MVVEALLAEGDWWKTAIIGIGKFGRAKSGCGMTGRQCDGDRAINGRWDVATGIGSEVGAAIYMTLLITLADCKYPNSACSPRTGSFGTLLGLPWEALFLCETKIY